MSKQKDDLLKDQNDPEQAGQGGGASQSFGNTDADPQKQDQKTDAPGLLSIEEHRASLNVAAPVFAAVMQAEGWAAGKKVPLAEFKKAVEAFLGGPMGGK